MGSKIVAMATTAILLAISIQMTVAPEQPSEENAKADPKLLTLFSDKDNLEKLTMVFKKAITDKEAAKALVQSYKKKENGMNSDLEEILNKVAANPKGTWTTLIKPVKKELDKKLMGYKVYGVCIKPLWHVAKGLGCMVLRGLGLTVYTAGELLQLLNNAAKEAMKNADVEPTSEVKDAMGQIHKAGDLVKGVGGDIDDTGTKELAKMNQKANPSSDNGHKSGSGNGSGSPNHRSLQRVSRTKTEETGDIPKDEVGRIDRKANPSAGNESEHPSLQRLTDGSNDQA